MMILFCYFVFRFFFFFNAPCADAPFATSYFKDARQRCASHRHFRHDFRAAACVDFVCCDKEAAALILSLMYLFFFFFVIC